MFSVRYNQGLIMSDVPIVSCFQMECVTNITYFLFICWNAGERDSRPCLFMIY